MSALALLAAAVAVIHVEAAGYGCVLDRCVLIGDGVRSISQHGLELSQVDCEGCDQLAEDEFLAFAADWSPRGSGGRLLATPAGVGETRLTKQIPFHPVSLSVSVTRGMWAKDMSTVTHRHATVVAASEAGARNVSFRMMLVRYPHPEEGPGCDPTPPPTPSPPPPPAHCQENFCAGNSGFYPVAPFGDKGGAKYTSEFTVPEIPQTFQPDEMTFYLYYNLVLPTGSIGKYNQFVPQLTLGQSFCNGTGPPEYLPTACELDPLHSWYIQAQYFFQLKCNDHANVVAGEMIPVSKGDLVTTSFQLNSQYAWELVISASSPSLSSGEKPRVSRVVADTPYMNSTLSWGDAPYDAVRLGACWEVYGMTQTSDYPSGMDYLIKTQAVQPVNYFTPWSMDEIPTCPYNKNFAYGVSAKNVSQGSEQVVYFSIKKPAA